MKNSKRSSGFISQICRLTQRERFKMRAVCVFLLLIGMVAVTEFAAEHASAQDEPASQRAASLIQVPLPVTTSNARIVQQSLARILEKAPNVVRPEDRPVVVLEFDTTNGKTGQGSDLEACQKLVGFLAGADMNRLNVIAYIPASRSYSDVGEGLDPPPAGQLNGYAVLIALASDEIAMHPATAIGHADVDKPGQFEIDLFRVSASQRICLPFPMAMAMIDSSIELSRVSTDDGFVYADQVMRGKIAAEGKEIASETLSTPGQTALLTSRQLMDYRLIGYQVESRKELERQLNVAENSLEGDPTLGEKWNPVQIELPPYVDDRDVQWIMRALDAHSPNLVIFRINATGGNTDACLRLASRVANYNPGDIRTVAFVEGQARGPVAVLALLCDHLVMSPESTLGGPIDPPLDQDAIDSSLPTIIQLAREKGEDWSLLAAAMNPELGVMRYRNRETGQTRVLSDEEHLSLENTELWDPLRPLAMDSGIDASTAEQLFIARAIADNMDALQSLYHLETEPISLAPTLADKWLEETAAFLASPFIAPWLLFGAVFFISTEMSAPGVGVPGFLGTLCLVLFFWSQFLEGNAHWLEILLFVVGATFVLMEIFLLPGVGIFGIGGVLMVVTSIVLASQTFIIPKTAAELNRLPISLSMVLAAGMGFFTAVFVLRKALPNTPYLKRMMLDPPKKDETGLSGHDREAGIDWSKLEGRKGVTISRLNPGGKARISGEVVDVITQGLMIDKGTEIEVVLVQGNRIEVRPIDAES